MFGFYDTLKADDPVLSIIYEGEMEGFAGWL